MPIKDEDARRKYNREYGRLRRAGLTGRQAKKQTVKRPLIEDEAVRLETVRDYLDVINRVILEVKHDEHSSTTQKARVIGYLINIAMRGLELSSIEERLAALENAATTEAWR